MQIDINNLVSISEANQNFSKIARMVDKDGAAVILKNNKPKYVLLEYNTLENDISDEDDSILSIGRKIIERNKKAFEELAK